jgi:exosortase
MQDGTVEAAPGFASRIRTPIFWASLFAVGLGIRVYYPLFFPSTRQTLGARGEEFFFQANEAAGAPVLILSLWLLYRRAHYRDLLLGPGAATVASLAFLSSVAVFGWGVYTDAADLRLASLIVFLVGVACLFGGRAGMRAYWLPILFLGFALPVSSVLIAATIFPIQLATAQYAGLLLNGIGFEALVQGDQILRPNNTFIVIETCSGVRTMVTLAMLTILLIDLFERRGWHAAILLALTPGVAFLVNGLRVVSLVLNPHSSVHAIHNLQGIAMLLVGLTTIYLIDGGLERLLGSRNPSVEDGDYGMARGEVATSQAARTIALCGVSFVLVVMLGLGHVVPGWQGRSGLAEKPEDLLTRVFGPDSALRLVEDYQFAGSVDYLAQARRRIDVDGTIVEIFLGVANEQKREVSILSTRLAWPASGYDLVEESFGPIVDAGPVVRRAILKRGAQEMVSYSWIERRQTLFVEWLRHALALDRSVFARPHRMLAIRLSTRIGTNDSQISAGERAIRDVWATLEPNLGGYAPTVRPSRGQIFSP